MLASVLCVTSLPVSLPQKNTMGSIQDIDLSRFVPQEVDNTGITVASMDRFTSRNKTQPTSDGGKEKKKLIF